MAYMHTYGDVSFQCIIFFTGNQYFLFIIIIFIIIILFFFFFNDYFLVFINFQFEYPPNFSKQIDAYALA